jgi:hypothetical protein
MSPELYSTFDPAEAPEAEEAEIVIEIDGSATLFLKRPQLDPPFATVNT